MSLDVRFVTPRPSARSGGYTSSSGDDEAFMPARGLSAAATASASSSAPAATAAAAAAGSVALRVEERGRRSSRRAERVGGDDDDDDDASSASTASSSAASSSAPPAITEEDVESAFSAARHGRHKRLEELFALGVPVDSRDRHGNTPLIVTAQNGHRKALKSCLRFGADMNATNVRWRVASPRALCSPASCRSRAGQGQHGAALLLHVRLR